MKYQPYPKYKDSGVEWIAEIPEGWQLRRLKQLSRIDSTGSYGEDFQHGYQELPVATTAQIDADGFFDVSSMPRRWFSSHETSRFLCDEDDILVVKSSGSSTNIISGKAGMVSQSDLPLVFSNFLLRVRTLRSVSVPRFVFFQLRSALTRQRVERMCSTTTYPNIDVYEYSSSLLPVPPLSTQSSIASFLDTETAKIDTLVHEYEDLIALLTEKRQALISHAVTRGLSELVDPQDPEFGPWAAANLATPVRFADSGVEWLGEIPEGWRSAPIKFFCKIGNGSTPNRDNPDYWSGDGFPWLTSSVVNQEEVTEATQFVTELALKECHLPIVTPPAVLVGITGQGKTRGMAAPLSFEATLNQHLAYLKPLTKALDTSFILRSLEAAYSVLRQDSDGAGSTKGAITCEQLGGLLIPVPPAPEQSAIAAFLTRETSKIDTLVRETQDAIELLKEHRSALVTAAVTGKINVEALG